MRHFVTNCRAAFAVLIAATSIPSMADQEPRGYYATLYAQASRLGSTSFDQVGDATYGTGLRAQFDTGLGFGGDFGFRYGNGWAAEVEWNYRRHNLKTLSGSNTPITEGDFASNIVFVNGLRRFPSPDRSWIPYLGAGVGWVQEIDFDLNSSGTERAWSKQGKLGVQWMAGVEIPVNNGWRLTTDLRVLSLGKVDLPAEEGVAGRLVKPRYNPVSVQVGLRRMF